MKKHLIINQQKTNLKYEIKVLDTPVNVSEIIVPDKEIINPCNDVFINTNLNSFWTGGKITGGWNKKMDISNIQSFRNYVQIFPDDSPSYRKYKIMDWMKDQLLDYGFMSTGKSYLVCIKKIKDYDRKNFEYLIMINGNKVDITRNYLPDVMKYLNTL